MSLSSSFGYYNNGGFQLPNRFSTGQSQTCSEVKSQCIKGTELLFLLFKCSGGKIPLPFANLPKPSLPAWAKCIFGLVFSLIKPFWVVTGGRLLSFHREIESIVQKVEDVAEIIDHVAESVEKIADDVAEKLPESGWMRGTVECIEEISKEVSDSAEEAIDIINKFQEVSNDVETFIEQVVDGEYEPKGGEEKVEELQITGGKLLQTGIAGTMKEETSAENKIIIKS